MNTQPEWVSNWESKFLNRYLDIADLAGCEELKHRRFFMFPINVGRKMRKKLKKAGFKEKYLKDPQRYKPYLEMNYILTPGKKFHIDDFPDFPDGVVTIHKDKHAFSIERDIEGALRALIAIDDMLSLLVDAKSVETYLRTLEWAQYIIQSKAIPGFMENSVKASLATRTTKKRVMKGIIRNIFQMNPNRPKTLGQVWIKIDAGHGSLLSDNGIAYIATIGNNKNGPCVIVDDGAGTKFEYAKRSLQRFINELK